MMKISKHTWLIIVLFIISRVAYRFFNIHFQYETIFSYWQYLDVETLEHNLLRGVWYDHAQPPFFNLFVGMILKVFGSSSPYVFAILFKLITLANALLLYNVILRLTGLPKIALFGSLLYLLSPASIIFENELFYTTFISMLLLTSVLFLDRFKDRVDWGNSIGFFLPLVIICLTRSLYHIFWLMVVALVIFLVIGKTRTLRKLIVVASLSILITGSWYLKNYFVFGKLSASSWIGMNLARNVFHDDPTNDSTKIEAYEPFSRISMYAPFISKKYERKYEGLNDLDLLAEYKNLERSDTLLNLTNINYIEVSEKYLAVSKTRIRANPMSYLKNVLQSSIIFFAPATRYPSMEKESAKIKYYDALYSFNLSHFVTGKQQRRVALVLSAFPKILIYLFVFYNILRNLVRRRKIDPVTVFSAVTIIYVFAISSLFEHYENMRFRYEVEPIFLLVLSQVIAWLITKRNHTTEEMTERKEPIEG